MEADADPAESNPPAKKRKARKSESALAAASEVPRETETSPHSVLKRGRSSAQAFQPMYINPIPSVSKPIVTKPVPEAPTDSKPGKGHKEAVLRFIFE